MSSSAVSRRFVALSTKRLHAFLSRPLGELDLRVVYIDGKVFRDHCMVIALGIDTQGRKHVLGLREGATETAAVTTGLLSDLVTRGLPTDRTLLFVVDGAAGLRRGVGRKSSACHASPWVALLLFDSTPVLPQNRGEESPQESPPASPQAQQRTGHSRSGGARAFFAARRVSLAPPASARPRSSRLRGFTRRPPSCRSAIPG